MDKKYKILGIDPGTHRVGYGVVEKGIASLDLVDAGLLSIKTKNGFSTLQEIKRGVDKLIRTHKPAVMAIEKLYFSKNQTTALSVAEARGVIILSALENGIPLEEYTPNEIKARLTGYGLADKKAVAKIVSMVLKTPNLKVIDDVSDAIGIAIVSSQTRKS